MSQAIFQKAWTARLQKTSPSRCCVPRACSSQPQFSSITGPRIHRLTPTAVHTAGTASARTVRVQVLTPPGALNRTGQRSFVADATAIVARIAGDPTQTTRTWVLLTEAAEGRWGIGGTAFGREEF